MDKPKEDWGEEFDREFSGDYLTCIGCECGKGCGETKSSDLKDFIKQVRSDALSSVVEKLESKRNFHSGTANEPIRRVLDEAIDLIKEMI